MPSLNTYASRARRHASHARAAIVAGCVAALASLLVPVAVQARGDGAYGDARLIRVQGRGFAEERAMRQAARAQRQQQMEGQRLQRAEQMNRRAPERELGPQAPGFRPPDPGDADRMGRPGRLTPDERRALRQQINEAGRDVYRPNSRP